jgi:hypothetical protein
MTTIKAGRSRWPVRLALLLGLLALLSPAPLRGQVAQAPARLAVGDTLYEVRLTTGESYVGQVVAVSGDQVTLRTASGVRVQFAQGQVASVRVAEGRVVDGAFWGEDPNLTRLMFAPTGRTVRAGEGYVGVFELFFPFVSVGITDWLTLSGGTPIVPEAIGQAFYLAPKARVLSTDRLDVSAGVLALFDLGDSDDFSPLGIFYGVGTWGTPDRAVTAGVGWGFAGDDVANRPVFLLGGESRASRRIKLMTENYLISFREHEYNREVTRFAGMASGGVRIIGERLSADAGLGFFLSSDDTFCCLPLVNFVYNFGGGR